MSKNKKIIIANWKMNPVEIKEAIKIFSGIKKIANKLSTVQTIVCPPFIFLEKIVSLCKSRGIVVGAQDVFEKNTGSFTGMISPNMLKKNGVEYVILGHSERRALGENDEYINSKVKISLKSGLKVILCVGEKERDDQGQYFIFIKNQILNSLTGITKNYLSNIFIAYEPIWAISNNSRNKAMSSDQIYEMVIFIKKILSDNFGIKIKMPQILYGGSVNSKNTKEILEKGDVDGLLVGRASLNIDKFSQILKITDNL